MERVLVLTACFIINEFHCRVQQTQNKYIGLFAMELKIVYTLYKAQIL